MKFLIILFVLPLALSNEKTPETDELADNSVDMDNNVPNNGNKLIVKYLFNEESKFSQKSEIQMDLPNNTINEHIIIVDDLDGQSDPKVSIDVIDDSVIEVETQSDDKEDEEKDKKWRKKVFTNFPTLFKDTFQHLKQFDPHFDDKWDDLFNNPESPVNGKERAKMDNQFELFMDCLKFARMMDQMHLFDQMPGIPTNVKINQLDQTNACFFVTLYDAKMSDAIEYLGKKYHFQ